MQNRFIFFLMIFFYSLSLRAQKPAFLSDYNKQWVDSVFNSLTLDQKIGQLLMPRGNFSGKPHDILNLEKWVLEYKVGGIVFFASNPTTQAIITNRLQSLSKTPLFIGQDFEWGIGMRLDSTDRFPYAVTLGAMQGNDELIEKMGHEVARQCKRIGVHINFAPVVDVNNNPNNPVINFRSFGENKLAVAQKGLAYMKGMQREHLFCTAKHFPGHGDTDVDSHHDIPIIKHDRIRLLDIELYPFKQLINQGLSGIMTAHLNIPSLESIPNLPSTFSSNIVQKLLREELKFEGLTFTDAMDMEGAIKNFPKGKAMVEALLAGNDILETFLDVSIAVEAIKAAIQENRIPMEMLNAKVKRILMAKSWVGLDKYTPIEISNLTKDLNTIEADALNHSFAEKSVTCLVNDNKILPIKDLTKKIAVISIEGSDVSDFSKMIENYTTVDYFFVPKNAGDSVVNKVVLDVSNHDIVLIGIHFTDIRASKKYGLTPENIKQIGRMASLENAVVCLFGSPFVLAKIPELGICKTLMISYQLTKYTESAMAQAIFGAIPTIGRLPMTINDSFRMNKGVDLPALGRLTYGVPELVGIDRVKLIRRIDSLVNLGLKSKAFPGCQLVIAKDNKVILQKVYGHHRYEDNISNDTAEVDQMGNVVFIDDAMDNFSTLSTTFPPKPTFETELGKVKHTDIYDLASITKIASSTLAVMRLVSEGKFNLDTTLADYCPEFKATNKAGLTFIDMLTHRSGLKAWIPFWKDAVDTSATIDKALTMDLNLEKSFIVIIKKPSFFKRLFGKKSSKLIDYRASLLADATLWKKVFKPSTIAWKSGTFSKNKINITDIQIADNLWLRKDYQKFMLAQIAASPLFETQKSDQISTAKQNVYSDLHFYLYPGIINRITGKPWTSFLDETYKKIGANSLVYNPKISLRDIVPTEYDSLFRQSLIHGRVDDEGAAMMGGISGHAGLFGNANDLTKLMQMYLNKGTYGGERFADSTLVTKFTSYQFADEKNRRGIGFDKKDFDPKIINAPGLSSDFSYGHSGFTGTYTWVDPAYNLVYVFLSNRVYPTRENQTINTLNIRTEIGNQIIKTILESGK
ncbi:MAG: serine hydrolase [Saprospiraceae bacterium]|nr:serine hydrolase [Saprospiraceae bacterium]